MPLGCSEKAVRAPNASHGWRHAVTGPLTVLPRYAFLDNPDDVGASRRISAAPAPRAKSWRMDEIYLKMARYWKYLYRAVDRVGDTLEFLLIAERDGCRPPILRERHG